MTLKDFQKRNDCTTSSNPCNCLRVSGNESEVGEREKSTLNIKGVKAVRTLNNVFSGAKHPLLNTMLQ